MSCDAARARSGPLIPGMTTSVSSRSISSPCSSSRRERLIAVCRSEDLVTAPRQNLADEPADRLLVLGDQHALGAGALRAASGSRSTVTVASSGDSGSTMRKVVPSPGSEEIEIWPPDCVTIP